MNRRYLMDTHCWLWANLQPESLSSAVNDIITDTENEVIFSVISAWEISIKHRLGKLKLPSEPVEYIPSRLAINQVSVLPIRLAHTLRVSQLPLHHNDPFDRLIIATAQTEGLVIIRPLSKVNLYPIKSRGQSPLLQEVYYY